MNKRKKNNNSQNIESKYEDIIQHDDNNDNYIDNDDNAEDNGNNYEDNVYGDNNNDNVTISTTTSTNSKSFVWEHFNRVTDNNGIIWIKCKYCLSGKYKMSGTGGSTGNLKRHLQNHRDKIDKEVKKQAEMMEKFLNNNKPIPFTNEFFREKLVHWIITDYQPFTVVESPEFCDMIKFCNPSIFIPSADTIHNDILKSFKNHQSIIKHELQNIPGKISFAVDMWTSLNALPFLAITCHYLDNDWNIKNLLLDFIYICGAHSGENIANYFLNSTCDMNILTKILAVTADNAANNETFLKTVENYCEENFIDFHHKKNQVRCLAHVMNLTTQKILKHIKAGEAQEENQILGDDNNVVEIIPKLRKLIAKIRSTPQRREKFSRQCGTNNKTFNLILDTKTRWNSTFQMLKRAFEFKEPLNEITLLDKDLSEYYIKDNEWEIVNQLYL